MGPKRPQIFGTSRARTQYEKRLTRDLSAVANCL